MKCDCLTKTSRDVLLVALTGHHEDCPHRPPLERVFRDLLKELVSGIDAWAAEEDGVHPDLWDAYCKAKAVLGEVIQ